MKLENVLKKGCNPWDSIYAPKKIPERINGDSEEQIGRCLSCSKADCDDCLAEFDRRFGRKQSMTVEELKIFLQTGTKKEAVNHFKCSRQTIWRKIKEIENERN